jgi:hypothetical protein
MSSCAARNGRGMMERMFLSIQHAANPLHVYCRLRDGGMGGKASMFLSRHYEIAVYQLVLTATRFGIALCRGSRFRTNTEA